MTIESPVTSMNTLVFDPGNMEEAHHFFTSAGWVLEHLPVSVTSAVRAVAYPENENTRHARRLLVRGTRVTKIRDRILKRC